MGFFNNLFKKNNNEEEVNNSQSRINADGTVNEVVTPQKEFVIHSKIGTDGRVVEENNEIVKDNSVESLDEIKIEEATTVDPNFQSRINADGSVGSIEQSREFVIRPKIGEDGRVNEDTYKKIDEHGGEVLDEIVIEEKEETTNVVSRINADGSVGELSESREFIIHPKIGDDGRVIEKEEESK